MSPPGPFYCVIRWDLPGFDHPAPPSESVQVKQAGDDEMSAVASVWYRGLGQEEGSPWADYLKKWTTDSAAKWFLDATKRQGARILVAEKDGKIVAMNGIVFEKRSGLARFFTGVVVAPENRREGIGSLLLHRSLIEAKKAGLHAAEVETIQGIPAVRYLYTKFGGTQKTISAQQ